MLRMKLCNKRKLGAKIDFLQGLVCRMQITEYAQYAGMPAAQLVPEFWCSV